MIGDLSQVRKIPELRKRILFTLGMIAVYRLGVYVSTPGIDAEALRRMFETTAGSLFGFINLFSGGALENFSIFSLGIAPYISMSIIMQVMTPSIPALAALKKEGEAGQRIITRYTRQGTIILALIQSYLIARGLEGQGLVKDPGMLFRMQAMITLTAGTSFMMWVGEQITERGIGNGVSMLIFAGIVARMPSVLYSTMIEAQSGQIQPLSLLFVILFCLGSIFLIVYAERTYRKIPIQYPRRVVAGGVAQAPGQFMPIKLNMTGVIPPIFASALMVIPATIASFSANDKLQDLLIYLQPGKLWYEVIFTVLILLFAYFYSSVIFNPVEIADNLKKRGGFIPTVRPGKETADYLYGVLNRLCLWAGVYIAMVCVIPQVIYISMGTVNFASVFGGTAILIVVGVTLELASQIESHVVARNYEAFMSNSSKQKGGLMGSSLRSRMLRR